MSESMVDKTAEDIDLTTNIMPKDPYSIPLEDIDMSDVTLFYEDRQWDYFERLRKEAPVHYCRQSQHGPYWSVTRYDDIMKVNTNHGVYSSDGVITIAEPDEDFHMPMFIAMDPPKHHDQRKVVNPVVAPRNLQNLEALIRQRVCNILDSLPLNKEFNWVEKVSIELTTQMLATLFDFPFEDRHKLTRWSDVATSSPESGLVESDEQRHEELLECLAYFQRLWKEREGLDLSEHFDLVTMLVNDSKTKDMPPMEYLGNLILLIVGGNDTTRNSISGGVLALNQHPEEYNKLRNDKRLIPNMVSEVIRWQTPLAHMRRQTLEDTELNGQKIPAGEKVIMWYVSGNRDPDFFDEPNNFIIDRPNARSHLSFGFGVHRCMGNRLAEMQLRILWEEIMKRFHMIEATGEPVRIRSSFVKGYSDLPVVLHSH